MSLRLAFWNCGVAPALGQGKRAATGKRSAATVAAVLDSILRSGVELIAGCEVDEDSVGAIRKAMKAKGVRRTLLVSKAGRSRWDLVVFYQTARVRCKTGTKVLVTADRSTIRAGYQVKVTIEEEDEFDLYLLHWRSRTGGSGHRYREHAALELSRHISRGLSKHDRRTVVLGDFNDEPFDRPLTTLRASRDPVLVQRRPVTYLYNPTWWLACPPASNPWERFGSYAYDSGRTTRRYLFDQALTSAHFLDEEQRRAPVVRLLSDVLDSVEQSSADIDHIPLELTLP